MPPPFNFQDPKSPQTPKRASNPGGLYSLFSRTFGGQKRSNDESSSSVSTPTGASSSPRDYLDLPASAGRKPLTRGLTEPSDISLLDSTSSDRSNPVNGFSGAPAGFNDLVDQLSHEHSTKDRIHAATTLVDYVHDYKLDNVNNLWSNASDMLASDPDTDTFKTALALFKACLQAPSLTHADTRIYFDLIVRRLSRDMTESATCLKLLTHDCKDYQGLDMNKVTNHFAKALKSTWEATDAARRKILKDKSGTSSRQYNEFWDTMGLINLSVKNSSSIFTELQLGTIIDEVLIICKRTRELSDLEESLNVVETVINHTDFPQPQMAALVSILCAMHFYNTNMREIICRILDNLLRSHHRHIILDQMYTILGTYPDQAENTLATATTRGAVQLFAERLSDTHKDDGIDLHRLLTQLAHSLKIMDEKLEIEALRLLCLLFDRPGFAEAVFAEDIWPSFSKAMKRCATGKHATGFLTPSASAPSLIDSQLRPDAPSNVDSDAFTINFRKIAAELTQMASTSPTLALQNGILPDEAGLEDSDRLPIIMNLLLSVSALLDDSTTSNILRHIEECGLNLPPRDEWTTTCEDLRSRILENPDCPRQTRIAALRLLQESYRTAFAYGMRDSHNLLSSMMNSIAISTDPHVLQLLIDTVVDIAASTDDTDLFATIVDHLHKQLLSCSSDINPVPNRGTMRGLGTASSASPGSTDPDTASVQLSKGIVRLFLRTIDRSYVKANKLYETLLAIVRSNDPPTDARIIALKVLVRLRADINHGIFVVAKTESESLAAALCRTADTDILAHIHDSPIVRPAKPDDVTRSKMHSGTGVSPLSRSNSAAGRANTSTSRMTRTTPPLWMYPGPKGLPEDPCLWASHVAFSRIDDSEDDSQKIVSSRRGVLDIGFWLELVLELIVSPNVDWEIISYVIVHLGGQLANHSLFAACMPQVKELRRTVCDQLMKKSCMEPPAFTSLKRSDVAVCLYHTLIMLISYRAHFQKEEEQDPIVKALVFGIGSWERTSEMCIHGLSICCHELPVLLIRYLDLALQKMTQIITQSNMAASILDFLATLARLPELFRNFGEDSYKNVFGICFRYIQYVRDQKSKQLDQSDGRSGRTRDSSNARSSRDLASPMSSLTVGSTLGETLPQYVYAITFHAMTFWFMAFRLQDRQKHYDWIIQSLRYKDFRGIAGQDDLAEVTLDMMLRVKNSDRDETVPHPDFAKPADGMISSKDYIRDNCIMTIDTAGRSGATQITYRRPSGTSYWYSRPMIVEPPRHQAPITIGLAADAFRDTDYVGITPEHIMQTMYGHTTLSSDSLPYISLPDDEATRRAISVFDRIPALDGHRVGIVYIGERQTSEASILANVMGSADYMDFLDRIGTLTELKDATLNTQGLDREFGTDGKFTYCWRDRVTELVFHITTMMPTNLEHDPQCSHKKRHIGNDFVKIIFNNSGLPFNFNTFPSDFNYVNIVIQPEARASFVETRLHAIQQQQRGEEQEEIFYKVTVMTRRDLPKISSASETKIISGNALPTFVRLLALNASVFCQVWANKDSGESPSSWRSRLHEIRKLREKHTPFVSDPPVKSPPPDAANMSPPSTSAGETGLMARANSLLRRSSVMLTDGSQHSAQRSSLTSATGGELERTSSRGSHDQ